MTKESIFMKYLEQANYREQKIGRSGAVRGWGEGKNGNDC